MTARGLVRFALLASCAIAIPCVARAADLPPLPPPDLPPGSTPTSTSTPPSPSTEPTPNEIVPDSVIARPPPPKDPNKELRLFVLGQGGAAVGRLFDIPFTAGAMRLGAGLHNDKIAFYGGFDLIYGSTSYGLRTWDASIMIGADARFARRFRAGGGASLGLVAVRKVTYDGNAQADALGAFLHASVDAFSFGPREDHAIFIDAAAHGRLFIGGTSGALVLSAGFRY